MNKNIKIVAVEYTLSEDLTVTIKRVKLENNHFLTREQLIISMELYNLDFYVLQKNKMFKIKIHTLGFYKLIQIENSNKYCDDLGEIQNIL